MRCSGKLWDVNSPLQSEDGEKSVVYDTVGSNVCMGDHKVPVAHLNFPLDNKELYSLTDSLQP